MNHDQRDKMISEYAQGAPMSRLEKTYGEDSDLLWSILSEARTGAFLNARHLVRLEQLQAAPDQSPETLAPRFGCKPEKVDSILRMLEAHGALQWDHAERKFMVIKHGPTTYSDSR